MELTLEIVFSLVQSDEEFSVDFDDAWRWIGYSSKQMAEEALKANLVEGVDFSILGLKSPKGGRPAKHIRLTIDGFKMFCMMAGTEKGRKVRLYFIGCEAELRRRVEEERQHQHSNNQKRLIDAMIDSRVVSRNPKFPEWFYQMLYKKRGQGWETKDPKKFRPSCVGTWTNETVYNRMLGGIDPGGIKDTLDKVNPRRLDGTRKDRHHWHLKDLGEYHLQTHLYALSALANTVPDGDWDRFMRKVRQAFPNGEILQMSLLDILEEMEESGYDPCSSPA